MIFKGKSSLTRQAALLCVPEKNSLVREKILESGDLILSWPQEYRPFFLRVRRFLRKSAQKSFLRKIQLDLLGKDVWDLIDGKKNIRTIIKEFAQHHQVNPREAEISVTLFMKSLGEKGLIVIRGG